MIICTYIYTERKMRELDTVLLRVILIFSCHPPRRKCDSAQPTAAVRLCAHLVGGGETPKDFTKPQQTIQSPNGLHKAPERL